MRIEDQLLFACTRQDFRDSNRQLVLDMADLITDWESVWELARNHGVAPIVYKNLKSANLPNLPREIDAKFGRYLFQNIARRERSEQQMLRTLHFLTEQGIMTMLVKGAALNHLVFDESWYTFSEDIDLLLKPTRAELSNAQEEEVLAFLDEINEQRSSLQESIEYDFYAHHDVTMNELLAVDFEGIWQEAKKIEIGDQFVYCMNDEDLLITACISSARKRYFRLKSLLDIAEIFQKRPGLDWPQVAKKAEAYQCGAIVYTAIRVADLTLGCNLPADNLAAIRLSKGRRQLIESLIHLLIDRGSLPGLSHYRGRQFGGRAINPALLLTFASFKPQQQARYFGRLLVAQPD